MDPLNKKSLNKEEMLPENEKISKIGNNSEPSFNISNFKKEHNNNSLSDVYYYIDNNIKNLNDKYDLLDKRVTNIDIRVTNIDKRVTNIDNQLADIINYFKIPRRKDNNNAIDCEDNNNINNYH